MAENMCSPASFYHRQTWYTRCNRTCTTDKPCGGEQKNTLYTTNNILYVRNVLSMHYRCTYSCSCPTEFSSESDWKWLWFRVTGLDSGIPCMARDLEVKAKIGQSKLSFCCGLVYSLWVCLCWTSIFVNRFLRKPVSAVLRFLPYVLV